MKYRTDFRKTVETGMDPRPFGYYLSGISNTFKKQAVVKFLKQQQPLMFLAKNMLFFCFWYTTTNVVSQKSQFYNADSAYYTTCWQINVELPKKPNGCKWCV